MTQFKNINLKLKTWIDKIRIKVLNESPWLNSPIPTENDYWVRFNDGKRNITLINPQGSQLRILLRVDCKKYPYPGLEPTSGTKGLDHNIGCFYPTYKSLFKVKSEQDIDNAVRYILMSEYD